MAAGGSLIGIAFGIATRHILGILQRVGASAEQQIALTLAAGYLVFYTANSPAKVSGQLHNEHGDVEDPCHIGALNGSSPHFAWSGIVALHSKQCVQRIVTADR